jgi:phospholipid/cholesterol/gamma-HCH transport system permease protein
VAGFSEWYIQISDRIAAVVLKPVMEIGDIMLFLGRVVRTFPTIPRSMHLIFQSMLEIGIRSLPITFVISIFAGATTAWQAHYQLQGIVSTRYIGTAVSKSIILELAPVLTGLVVAGRIGSSIAASLGAMRVTEQIDALSTMAINPYRYLVLPRFAAGVIMVPVLTIYSCFFGLLSGVFISLAFLDVPSGIFIFGLKHYFHYKDVFVSLSKAFVFGGGLSLFGCYYGFAASGGAEGVGKAAIRAYVSSAIFILLTDFAVAALVL